jgi:XTP/dITP diphosphohydrolase
MKKILIATHNLGKLEEFKSYLKPYFDEIISLRDLKDEDDVEEDQDSYEGNALKKGLFYYQKYQIPTVSDDSGLELDEIPNYPGIYSARIGVDDEQRNHIILEKLKNSQNRKAKMISVITFISKQTFVFRGEVAGIITTSIKGNEGFGYDKIFYIPELKKTFGEITRSEKMIISHRGKALQQCIQKLKEILYVND